MPDEPNIPTHRYYQKSKHVRLAKNMMTKSTILAAGIDLIDGGSTSFAAQVEALLAGTSGFAIDPTDASTMWLESTKVTQVSAAADPVGCIRTKWGNAQYDIIQATGASRPAWNGSNCLEGDGSDDQLQISSIPTIQNAPYAHMSFRFRCISNPAASRWIVGFSAAATTQPRAVPYFGSSGEFAAQIERTAADATNTKASAASVLSTGVDYLAAMAVDYAGTGVASARLNGADLTSGTWPSAITGTPANAENATSFFKLFAFTGIYFHGRITRGVFLPFQPSAGQLASIEGWIAEAGAL
jgi:hypothetical protein